LRLPKELAKLDRVECLILDDIGYVQQDREEMEVLFTLLAERYKRRSTVISTNLVFSEWDQIFKNPMATMVAVDRVVHHSVIPFVPMWCVTDIPDKVRFNGSVRRHPERPSCAHQPCDDQAFRIAPRSQAIARPSLNWALWCPPSVGF
jgi:hypothetical protein